MIRVLTAGPAGAAPWHADGARALPGLAALALAGLEGATPGLWPEFSALVDAAVCAAGLEDDAVNLPPPTVTAARREMARPAQMPCHSAPLRHRERRPR